MAKFKKTPGPEGVHPLEAELEELLAGPPEHKPPSLIRAPVGWSPVPRCDACGGELKAGAPFIYVSPEHLRYHPGCPVPRVYYERPTTPWPKSENKENGNV